MTLRYWIAANHWPGMYLTYWQSLMSQAQAISDIFSCNPSQLEAWGATSTLAEARSTIDWQLVEADLKWAEKPHQHIITYEDDNYPALLKEIVGAPLLLYIRGKNISFSTPCLAIVGSRKPTPSGAETAFAFAKQASELGLGIASGLALGIDAAAHRGALAAKGFTMAVLGSGLDNLYPPQHRRLAEQLAETGALISEFSPQTPPKALNFPRRNRLISGLSIGVLVVEAALKSGSLITARYAAEQGRETFAIPGSIYNHVSRGCHQLIRQGAKLVESIQDVVEELGSTVDFLSNTRQDVLDLVDGPERNTGLTRMQQQLWNALDDAPTTLDQLLARCELAPAEVMREIVNLELQGVIKTTVGGYQRCRYL